MLAGGEPLPGPVQVGGVRSESTQNSTALPVGVHRSAVLMACATEACCWQWCHKRLSLSQLYNMAAKADNGPTATSTSGAESALPQLLACRLLQLYSSKMVSTTGPLVALLKYA